MGRKDTYELACKEFLVLNELLHRQMKEGSSSASLGCVLRSCLTSPALYFRKNRNMDLFEAEIRFGYHEIFYYHAFALMESPCFQERITNEEKACKKNHKEVLLIELMDFAKLTAARGEMLERHHNGENRMDHVLRFMMDYFRISENQYSNYEQLFCKTQQEVELSFRQRLMNQWKKT